MIASADNGGNGGDNDDGEVATSVSEPAAVAESAGGSNAMGTATHDAGSEQSPHSKVQVVA